MNESEIESFLTTKWAGRKLAYSDIIDSTNNVAEAAGADGEPSGFLAVADRQDAGRGSRGRNWVSPAGYNIFMSIMVRPDIPMDRVSGLTLVMAMAVARAVEDIVNSETEPCIKWPNDVVLNKRKICGILTELHPNPDMKSYYVVIGVGINVNQPIELFPDEIRDSAGSCFSETGEITDRSALIALCMKFFENYYESYCKTCDMSLLKKEYESRLININRQVKILDPKEEYEAYAKGITDEGALIIEKKDGSVEHINAGEVSVRGLYGYI